ncbi:ABC-type sugar transport system, periplasmic component [Thermoproteus tenax Kra 1]|uniref:ABC-type sugar transport system, periplasmic component n=2 Tax=Thermoproteus tenax TaxID=2271 RepID=G4RMA0_THETK|nr:ABC-type sugar transport system, periplasmic component [Thermoproteus tenax Kra 1]
MVYHMRRSLAIYIVVAIVVVAVAATVLWFYQAQSAPSAPAPQTQSTTAQVSGTLTVLVPTGDPTLMPYIQLAANEFMKKYPNVKVIIEPVPFGQMVQTALTALQNKNPDPSLIIFYPSQASTLGPYLADLRPYFNSGLFNKSDIPMSALVSVVMVSRNGTITKIFGVPFQMVFGYVLVYRKSIFDNATLQAEFKQEYGFDLNPLTWSSWNQLIDAAEFLQSKHVAKYALLFPDGLQQAIFNGFITVFYTYALNDSCVGIPADVAKGAVPTQGYWAYFRYTANGAINITVGCPSFLQALRTYKKLVQFQPPITVQAMEYDQLRDLFLTGDYAMVAAWTSFIPIYNNASISKVAGDIAIAPLPGGRNPYGTGLAPTFIGINPYAKNPDLAAQFIAFLISPEMYKLGAEKVGFVPATISGIEAASQVPSMSWLRPFVPLLKAGANVTDIQRLTLVNRVTNFFTDLRPYFINQVANYLRGQQDAETTQLNIYNTWLNIMKVS